MSNEIRVPDIGDFDAVDVIEVLIKAGDSVENGQSVIVLESDKASMEVPADSAGTIASVAIKVGDKVKQGDLIATLSGAAAAPAAAPAPRFCARVLHLSLLFPSEPGGCCGGMRQAVAVLDRCGIAK